MNYMEYLKTQSFPLFWCGGCGNGAVLSAIVRSFAALGYKRENTVVVTGIGCWGKADDYVTTNSFHGTHGRALAFATGIKLANPRLHVIVLMGDGDGVTIGGNHFIHAARRNVDVTAILVNNYYYSMTGGQYSGSTPENSITSTSRYGHIEPGFDICKLAEAAGAPFVARISTDNPLAMEKLITEGLNKQGFSFIEVIAPCPTHFGKNNGMRNAADLMTWVKGRSVSVSKATTMNQAALTDKLIMGKLVDIESEDYGAKYQKLIAAARNKE
ncbi:MAG: 2-oxoacid:ferredoxin oxidoreductase subunit beta [Clostridiales bacterium]|jgi:2-oxoglutarate ferredoxin oxidoreductase subunit beta|nr:2-oxoacid:ferredoxin oxidoreductase subunit beta [Clostridiales bacterium]